MKKPLTFIALIGIAIALSAAAQAQQKKIYPDRWVYANGNFKSDKDLEAMVEIIHTAAEHGFNGMVLSGMDHISMYSPEQLARLIKVKEVADANHIEIIPAGFGTGYGGAILSQDKNLAEGLLVQDALFVAKGGSAQFVADSPAKLVNGEFEQYQGNRFSGFTLQDEPGKKTFVDTTVTHSGKASLRLENFGETTTEKPADTGGAPPEVIGMKDSRYAESLLSRECVGEDRRCRAGIAVQHQVVHARRTRPQSVRAARAVSRLRLEKGDHFV